jgi:hypothetical protein
MYRIVSQRAYLATLTQVQLELQECSTRIDLREAHDMS